MKYFRDKLSGEVFGYEQDQVDLISAAKKAANMEDITKEWPPKQAETVFVKDDIRNLRNSLLAQSDWTQVADAPVNKSDWAIYRQALRGVPQQQGYPTDIIWPTKPE